MSDVSQTLAVVRVGDLGRADSSLNFSRPDSFHGAALDQHLRGWGKHTKSVLSLHNHIEPTLQGCCKAYRIELALILKE